MKVKFIRITALIFALLICLSACGETDVPAVTDEVTETDSAVICEEIDLIGTETPYKIIRADNASQAETDAAVKLKKAFSEKYGNAFTAGIGSDFLMENLKNDVITYKAYEILIGETNRQQSVDALAVLLENEYVIKAVDDKIVIIGENSYATQAAVDYFIENYLNAADSDKFTVRNNLLYAGKREETRPPLADGCTLRLLSYNLGCGVGINSDTLTILDRYMPDLIGFQESNKDIHSGVIAIFIKNHPEYKFAQKYHKGSSTLCYTPIVYNSKKVTLVKAGVEWLRSRYTGTNTKSLAFAVFEDKDGRKFAMINFHGAVVSADYDEYKNLSADERNALAAQFRLDNAKQLCEVKDQIISEFGEIPVTINGDCNFNNSSEPFKYLISQNFKDCELTAKSKTNSGYKTSFSYSNGLPGTGNSIDHILGYGTVYFGCYVAIRDKEAGTASDHCPIYADFNPFGNQ